MVMAQSLFIALQQQNPGVEIDVLAPAWSLPILARMSQVRNGIVMPVGHGSLGLAARYAIGKQLRKGGYDRAIVIPRSWKSALVPFIAGIPQRTGYRGEMRYGLLNDMRPLDKNMLTQTVQRYVNLGYVDQGLAQADKAAPETPYPQLTVDNNNQQQLLTQLGLMLDYPVVGFMPGAEYGPAKQWSPKSYAALARKLVEQGKQVWIFGSQKDAEVAEQIVEQAGSAQVHNLCGKTQLADVVDLIALCKTVVSNDSGLMHVAAAVGCKLVALYGSSTPDYTPPLSDRAHVIWLGLECSPCFKRECPYGHYNCLNNISVDAVIAALNKVEQESVQ
jgi:heptosyltransferase-2